MAARRAGGGATGLVIATILFAILFVVSTVLAIVFYTQIAAAENKAEQLEDQMAKLVTDDQLEGPLVSAMLNDPEAAGTLVAKLVNERNQLADLITGDEGDRPEQITAKLQADAVGWTPGEILNQKLASYKANMEAALAAQKKLASDLEDARDKVNAAAAANKEANAVFLTAKDNLKSNVTELQSSISQFKEQAAAETRKLEERLDSQHQSATRTTSEYEAQIQQLKLKIAELEQRIRVVLKQIGKEGLPVQTERTPDGRIVSVEQQERLAYINLGSNDHVPLGLTFEVYDKKTGVTKDEFGDWRGKATIEVVNTDESTSTCRIVRIRENAVINSGDVIQNLVYDPDMTFEFHVFGEFDIDYVGRPTQQDRRRIEAMIEDWGGRLNKELGFTTDFLVLGQAPEPPEPLDPSITDPIVIEEHVRREQLYQQYQNLVGRAAELKIPVLNQSRFLVLTGYYQR